MNPNQQREERDLSKQLQLSLGLRRPSLSAKDLAAEVAGGQGDRVDSNSLGRAWDELASGAFEPSVRCWPGWAGIQLVLDYWRQDYGAWRALNLVENRKARLDWARRFLADGTRLPPIEFPCRVVPAWIEGQTWISLLPAPAFGLGCYPTVIHWLEAPQEGTSKLQGMNETLLLGHPEHQTLWAPADPEVRTALLHQAHLQGAVFEVV